LLDAETSTVEVETSPGQAGELAAAHAGRCRQPPKREEIVVAGAGEG
jgi:hypothetical protein